MEEAVSPENSTFGQVRQMVERALDEKKGDDGLAYVEAVQRVAKDLASRYPDHRDYHVWHLLAGSSHDDGVRDDDFPGEDAVLPFLRKIA